MSKKNRIIFYKDFKYCFFTRNGGVSKKNFSSLNCAFNKGDNDINVKKNRKYVREKFCSKKKIILINQVHSNKIFFIDKITDQILSGDGIISDRKDLILGVLTADCAPIVILGKKYFGIIHAGWKGTFSGIIENALNFFFEKGECKEDIFVDVGPHLKKNSFEVKGDFLVNLKKQEIYPLSLHQSAFLKDPHTYPCEQEYLVELELIDLLIFPHMVNGQIELK